MTHYLRLAATICVVAVGNGAAQSKRVGDSAIAGTYVVRICRAPCDPAQDSTLAVRGTVVLLARSIPRHLLPSLINEDCNACFVLEEVRPDPETYAGVIPRGVVGWDRDSTHSLVEFSLYWSVDARYWVRASIEDGVLRGSGQSHLAIFPIRAFPIDSIEGRRVGPPDQSICVEAASGGRS